MACDMTNLSLQSATGYLFYFGMAYADVRQQCAKKRRAGDKKPISKTLPLVRDRSGDDLGNWVIVRLAFPIFGCLTNMLEFSTQ